MSRLKPHTEQIAADLAQRHSFDMEAVRHMIRAGDDILTVIESGPFSREVEAGPNQFVDWYCSFLGARLADMRTRLAG